jgi:predicted unusual protein kinase regulating ubiquinone biosynthesis (AarF/ABC1/UbiB family)
MNGNNKAKSTFLSRSRRTLEILSLILRGARKYAEQRLDSTIAKVEDESQQRREFARWLKDEFVKLGPYFIKLGQIISTRADLFYEEVVEEMAHLQDDVPPASFDEIRRVVESELGAPVEDVFVSIDSRPLATASIGQIHKAVIEVEGKRLEVVIKVQRPGIRELVENDLSVFEFLAQHFFFLPRLTQGSDIKGTLKELRETFDRELDYLLEADNVEIFSNMFNFNSYRVAIPGVVWSLNGRAMCTKSVLTLRYVPGTKISEFKGSRDEVNTILGLLVVAFLKQFVIDGRFHADPHPGNIAYNRDARGIYLIFYDLGMVGVIEPRTREALKRMAVSIFDQDARGVVQECIVMGILPREALADSDVIEVVNGFLIDISGGSVSLESVQELRENLFNASEVGVIQTPPEFTFIARALLAFEGLFRALKADYPDIDTTSLVLREALPFAGEFFGDQLGVFERVDYDAKRLQRLLTTLITRGRKNLADYEKGTLKISVQDKDVARTTRRLKYGVKSTNAAILFLAFFAPGTVLLFTDHWLEGGPLVAASVFFLERWWFSEKRMDK